MPGSFNPLHEGHLKLMEAAHKHFPDLICTYELSLHNADKGDLSSDSVFRRIEQFDKLQLNLAITNSPLFVDKA